MDQRNNYYKTIYFKIEKNILKEYILEKNI